MVHFALPTALDAWRATCSAARLFCAFLFLSLGASAVSFAASNVAPAIAPDIATDWLSGIPENNILAYEISRKGKRLGFQTLEFTTLDNGDLQVDVHIEIDFAIIIPLFRYTHDNREIWRDGKLLSLQSKTDNNGKDEFVDLRVEDDRLTGAGTDFADNLSPDMLSTSYFNPNFIRQQAVISSQDGRFLEIGVEEVGRETLVLEAGTVEATRFRLTGKLRIDIWYTDDGRWVKTTFSRGGNTLVIEEVNPASLPARNKWRRP